MALLEGVGGGPEVDGDFVDLIGIDEVGLFVGIAVAHAEDSVGEIFGEAVGGDVDEHGGEVGVYGGGFDPGFESDGAGDLHVGVERLGGIDEDVVAVFGGALIARAGLVVNHVAAERAADGGDGIRGIEGEFVGGFFFRARWWRVSRRRGGNLLSRSNGCSSAWLSFRAAASRRIAGICFRP